MMIYEIQIICYSYTMEIKDVSLKDYSSLRIGGEGKLVVIKNEEELMEAVNYAAAEGRRIHILGEGTNTYFAEYLENLLVLKIEIKGIETRSMVNGQWLIVGAGENWDDVVKYAIAHGLWGIENLSYIPGTVGAAPVQNIGAYGMELKDTLISLRAYDTEEKKFVQLSNKECHFAYRDSIFKHEKNRFIIVSITLQLTKEKLPVLTYKPLDLLAVRDDVTLEEIRDVVIHTRTLKLPDYNLHPNTGSFFKNPILTLEEGENLQMKYPEVKLMLYENRYKVSAAWLIDHIAEMKGTQVGDIGTWPAQPLVVVNYGNATAVVLNSFVAGIINKVKNRVGVLLEKEVNFIE